MARTALQLVNQVRRRHRMPDVTVLTDELSVVLLDAINSAMNQVLEERSWEFQKRMDEELPIYGDVVSTSTVTNGSTILNFASIPSTVTGSFLWRLNISGSSDLGNTAVKISNWQTFGSIMLGALESAWQGADVTNGTATVFASEYQLPDTVRDVLSVRYQEQEVDLWFIDKQEDFDSRFPRPHDEISDDLRIVAVGGYSVGTGTISTNRPAGVGLRVHPPPDTDGVLHYDYIERFPQFTTASPSTSYANVPHAIDDLVVDLAYALSLQSGVGNQIQDGVALEVRAIRAVQRRHVAHRADQRRRVEIPSLDHVGKGNAPRWPPRSVNTF